jgi:hypothetical protein
MVQPLSDHAHLRTHIHGYVQGARFMGTPALFHPSAVHRSSAPEGLAVRPLVLCAAYCIIPCCPDLPMASRERYGPISLASSVFVLILGGRGSTASSRGSYEPLQPRYIYTHLAVGDAPWSPLAYPITGMDCKITSLDIGCDHRSGLALDM